MNGIPSDVDVETDGLRILPREIKIGAWTQKPSHEKDPSVRVALNGQDVIDREPKSMYYD